MPTRMVKRLDELARHGQLGLLDLRLRLERFAALAVPALVAPLVDVAVVVDSLDELAAALERKWSAWGPRMCRSSWATGSSA